MKENVCNSFAWSTRCQVIVWKVFWNPTRGTVVHPCLGVLLYSTTMHNFLMRFPRFLRSPVGSGSNFVSRSWSVHYFAAIHSRTAVIKRCDGDGCWVLCIFPGRGCFSLQQQKQQSCWTHTRRKSDHSQLGFSLFFSNLWVVYFMEQFAHYFPTSPSFLRFDRRKRRKKWFNCRHFSCWNFKTGAQTNIFGTIQLWWTVKALALARKEFN